VDDFLGYDKASLILQEIQCLQQSQRLNPNGIRFIGTKTIDVFKPGVYEADLHGGEGWGEQLDWIFRQGAALLAQELNSELDLGLANSGHTVKAQINQGVGGCFPWHYDNPGTDKRRLTCILYLNHNWEEAHGGELVVAPFLQKPKVIQPIFDRLVIFYSETMLHRVKPALHERYCLTIWLDADQEKELPWPGMQDFVQQDSFLKSLANHNLQRTISRGIYAEEFEKSLKECMGHSPDFHLLLETHTSRIQELNMKMGPLITHLRNMKIPIE
jgi:hypothetical protein